MRATSRLRATPQAASVNEHDLLETRLLGHALNGRRAAQGAAVLPSQPGREAATAKCVLAAQLSHLGADVLSVLADRALLFLDISSRINNQKLAEVGLAW
jgi:hypothetical protein